MVRTLRLAFARPAAWALVSLAALSLVIVTALTVAQAQEKSPPKKPAPKGAEGKEEPKKAVGPQIPKYTSVRKLPGSITVGTLSNGLTVIVQENHVAPVATVRCYVKNTGSAFEGKHLGAGLSHVLEHVVAGGTTRKRPERETRKLIDSFGGATNAYTSHDMTVYFIDCPAKNADMAIELVADSMQHVTFDPSEFARELLVVNRELDDGEVDRSRVQWKLLHQSVYTEHPARHPTIGYQEVLNATTNQTIIDFYHERYIPNNQVFVVVGDVNTDNVLSQVARHWIGTDRKPETLVAMNEEPEQLSPRDTYFEMEGKAYELVYAWPTIKLSNPDLYALDLAAYILAEGESSRMARRLKYDLGLVTSVNSASFTPHYVNGFFAVFANCTPDTWEEASKEILKDVYKMKDELVSPTELAKAKKQKAAELVIGHQSVQDMAESIGRSVLTAGDPLFDQHYVAEIQKVTAEQVRDVARKYFVPNRLNRIIIAPTGAKKTEAAGETLAQESAVELHKLENGLKVLVKRVPHLPLVNMQAYSMGSTLVETDEQSGLATLTAAMLDQGVKDKTADEIAEYFDSIGGQFGMSAGRNSLFGSITTLADDFPKASALFSECVTRPTFPDEQFKKMQQLQLAGIAQRGANPQQEIFEAFSDSLPKTTPYHLVQGGKAATVEKLTVADCKKFHATYFVPQNMIVTVFGNIDPKAALALVKEQYGHLKPAADFKPIPVNRDNALPESIIKHKTTAKPTGMVLVGYPIGSIYDKADSAAITLLDTIMSGYSYPGGWLHKDLREDGKLVYYVHGMAMTGPAPGYFAILSQTDPDSVAEVVKRIEQNVQKAKAGNIQLDELELARSMVLALHAQDNTTISSQAQEAALNELYGLGYDYEKSYEARIQAVKLDDVIRVARKYLDKSVLVTSSPAEKSPVGAVAPPTGEAVPVKSPPAKKPAEKVK